MELIQTTNIDLELKVIDKLLSLSLGEQIYAKQISLLFKVIEFKSNPIFVTKSN